MSAPINNSSAVPHWRYQRLTALALVPLSIWLLIFLDKVLTVSYADTVAWLITPINAIALILWLITVFYHAALGVQVVLEDYVKAHQPLVAASNVFFLVSGLAAIAAIVFIIFTR